MALEQLTEQQQATLSYIRQRLGIDFNEGQEKLFIPTSKPLLAFAVPGSGKTNTMTGLVTNLELVMGIPGAHIWVVTFSKKAAREFKSRHRKFMKKIDHSLESKVNIKTIHASCYFYLDALKGSLNLDGFSIAKKGENIRLMRDIIASIRHIPEDKVSLAEADKIVSAIGWFDNRLLFEQHEIVPTLKFRDLDLKYQEFKVIYENFKYLMNSSKKFNQDELMLTFYNLLKNNNNVRQIVQKSIKHICVDEFQDTTPLQYEIIKMMKSETCGITVVGDSDQSVYKWRGASNVVFDFMKDFEDHVKAEMNVNYRCPEAIIQCANSLIANSRVRIPIEAVGTDKDGEIQIIPCKDNKQASFEIGSRIIKEYLTSNRDNNTLADKLVLYRNHKQAMLLVYLLATNEVPVNLSENVLPHKDKIIQDLYAIINMLQNPRDCKLASEHLRKVSSQLRNVHSSKCPFFNAEKGMHFVQVPVTVKDVNVYTKELRELLEIAKLLEENKPAIEVFKRLVPMYMNNYYMKYRIYEYSDKTPDDVDAIVDFLYTAVDEKYTFFQFKYQMNLCEQFLNSQKESMIGLNVLTMHGAKGLEADTVYILDSNKKTNPNENVIQSLMDSRAYAELEDYIQEERSLFYVAMTRATRKLIMTYNKMNPSPFNLESGLHAEMKAYPNILSLESLGVSPNLAEKARNTLLGVETKTVVNKTVEQFDIDGGVKVHTVTNTIHDGQIVTTLEGPQVPTAPQPPNAGTVSNPINSRGNVSLSNTINNPKATLNNPSLNVGMDMTVPKPPTLVDKSDALKNALNISADNKSQRDSALQEHFNKGLSELTDIAALAERPKGDSNNPLGG